MTAEKYSKSRCLIVDDSEINREILKDILAEQMDIVEAKSGKEALKILEEEYKTLDMVLLDLIMPEIDGFEVLSFMKNNKMTDTIPVIMISTENRVEHMEHAYDLGAVDFITRPFSDRIVLRRVLCTLSLYQKQKELGNRIDEHYKNQNVEIDAITGLYFDRAFFEKIRQYLSKNEKEKYCITALDIDHFKLFNSYYGWDEGNQYLANVGKKLRQVADKFQGIAGYMGGDDFAVVVPESTEFFRDLKDDNIRNNWMSQYEIGFSPKFGVYEIEDKTLPIETIYDRAVLALSGIKGDYSRTLGWYESSILQENEDEYHLLLDFHKGLKNNEFIFYVQPKFNMQNGRIIGGEALVRWQSPEKGIIGAGFFIPALEKNGVVLALDRYIWESVCNWQREWINEGKRPLPLSVNVSRADIFGMDVTAYFKKLMEKYHLDPKWIEIEITESAFVEIYERVNEEVDRLHEAGFTVLMDDFGSGYSSLNVLKDMNIDILKIDMKFLKLNDYNAKKGISILESIVNMARQMQLPTIVEGVETEAQVDLLTGMGCDYAQGFYYCKPIPLDVYEEMIADPQKRDTRPIHFHRIEPLHFQELFDENIFSDTVINNMIGAIGFFEKTNENIRITRINEQCFKMLKLPEKALYHFDGDMTPFVVAEDMKKVQKLFGEAKAAPLSYAEGIIQMVNVEHTRKKIRLKVFFLADDGEKERFCAIGEALDKIMSLQ